MNEISLTHQIYAKMDEMRKIAGNLEVGEYWELESLTIDWLFLVEPVESYTVH